MIPISSIKLPIFNFLCFYCIEAFLLLSQRIKQHAFRGHTQSKIANSVTRKFKFRLAQGFWLRRKSLLKKRRLSDCDRYNQERKFFFTRYARKTKTFNGGNGNENGTSARTQQHLCLLRHLVCISCSFDGYTKFLAKNQKNPEYAPTKKASSNTHHDYVDMTDKG